MVGSQGSATSLLLGWRPRGEQSQAEAEKEVLAEGEPKNHTGSPQFRRFPLKESRRPAVKIGTLAWLFRFKKQERDQKSVGLQSWARK